MHKLTVVGLSWINVKKISFIEAEYTLEIDGNKSEGKIPITDKERKMFERLSSKIEERLSDRLEDAIKKAQTL